MPSKTEVIEDLLAATEEELYKALTAESYPCYLGGRVEVNYTAKPRLEIKISEIGKPGPKLGQKFKPRVGPSKRAMQAMNGDAGEEF